MPPLIYQSALRSTALLAALLAAALLTGGCAQQKYVTRRSKPLNVLANPLKLLSRGGPKPTPRTEQLLRRYDLVNLQKQKPEIALTKLEQEIKADPNPDKICSYAELAYLHGRRLEEGHRPKEALDFYGGAVAHAYWFLLDPQLDRFRNPYDPQFRGACDIYNESLAAAMRLVIQYKGLKPGQTQTIQTGKQQFAVNVVLRGPWHAEDIEKLEFVSEFQINGGLTNHYQTFGLGVPLIAVRGRHEGESPAEQYYAPGLCFPVTAFLRVENQTPQQAAGDVHRCTLELYDPLFSSDIAVCSRLVPLETDLSTPLAFFLDQESFREKDISTAGLINPNATQGAKGLFMVEPFDPNRIPVVFVHGLWSSPTTWMEMFNDLRAFPEIRSRYQFWFFLYPSGQPFWTSASQLRDTLAEVRQALDPEGQNPNLDQLVLVGHSMGGLVSKLQTLESGDDFWHVLSDKPIEQLRASDEERARLAKCFYFHPNPSVKRVVSLGTPHRGSSFASTSVRDISRRLIVLPEKMLELANKVVLLNPGYFKSKELLTMSTSIDSLAPDCPIFPVMLAAPKASWTSYHNIVGIVPKATFVGRVSEEGDGVVAYKSAHLDDVASEITVEADHLAVHRHPLAILEVRRILMEHLAVGRASGLPVQQASQPAAQPSLR